MAKAAVFVSQRLQRPAAALLCLMLAQMALVVTSCDGEPVGMFARVAITPAP